MKNEKIKTESPATMRAARPAWMRQVNQLIDVALFGVVALCFYVYGPFWDRMISFRILASIFLGGLIVLFRWAVSNTSISATQTYHVPKRFGVSTIVVATLVVAFLVALMQSVKPTDPALLRTHQVAMMVVLGFVTLVSSMQLFLNRVPRLASTGAGFVVAFGVDLWLMPSLFGGASRIPIWMGIICAIAIPLIGAFVGYLAGAMIAGVFLAADSVAPWWRSPVVRDTHAAPDWPIVTATLVTDSTGEENKAQ